MRGSLRLLGCLACGAALAGCADFARGSLLPKSLGEQTSGYGYVPLDGLAVQEAGGGSCASPYTVMPPRYRPILQALPDQSMRFSIADVEPSGQLSFGPAKLTVSNQAYHAVLDYIVVDTVPVDFYLRKSVESPAGEVRFASVWERLPASYQVLSYEAQVVPQDERKAPRSASGADAADPSELGEKGQTLTIPIYVGVGMRLTADFRTLKGGVILSSLDGIGAQGDLKRLTGGLTMQSMGIFGSSAPIQITGKLDQSTVENALMTISNSRVALYADAAKPDFIQPQPRVVGLYSPIGTDPALIGALYAALSRTRPVWHVPCVTRSLPQPGATH